VEKRQDNLKRGNMGHKIKRYIITFFVYNWLYWGLKYLGVQINFMCLVYMAFPILFILMVYTFKE